MFKKWNYLFILLMTMLMFISTVQAEYLVWDANPDADYYIIYCSDTNESDYQVVFTTESEKVNSVDFSTILFNGKPLELNKNYNFLIKAFNCYGNSSDFSDVLVYSIYKPGQVLISLDKNKIYWSFADANKLSGYQLSYSNGSTVLHIPLDKTVTSYNLCDLNLTELATYTFTIQPIGDSGVYGDVSNAISYTRRLPSKVINLRTSKTINH